MEKGVNAAGVTELLAVILRTGNGSENVLDLARKILIETGWSLSVLGAMSPQRLMQIGGIGPGKAVSLCAAMELGKRAFNELTLETRTPLTDPALVYPMMLPHLKGIDHEECWLIYLNKSSLFIGKERLTSGALDRTLIDPALVAKRALERQASGLILVHNHPSGDPQPSYADIEQTRLLKKALSTFNIQLLDHIIISESSYYCFSTEAVTEVF